MQNEKKKSSFYYGWVVVWISFVTVSVAGVARISYSPFCRAFRQELGLGAAQGSLPFSLSMFVVAIFSPLIGKLFDRFGPKKVFPIGAVVLALGLLLTSQARSLWMLCLFYGVIASLGGVSLLTVPQSALVSRWFRRRRGLASGIVFSAFGLAGGLGVPIMVYLIQNHGWRLAYVFYAVALCILIVPLNAFFVAGRPEDLGLSVEGEDAGKTAPEKISAKGTVLGESADLRILAGTPYFWFFMIGSFLGGARMMTIQAHFIDLVHSRGFSVLLATAVQASVYTLWSAGSIGGGFLADRVFGHRAGNFFITLLEAVGLLCLFLAPALPSASPALITGFVVLYGFGGGGVGSCFAAAVACSFPRDRLAILFGCLTMAFGIGGALGPWLAGVLFDSTASHTTTLYLLMMAAFVGAVSVGIGSIIAKPSDS